MSSAARVLRATRPIARQQFAQQSQQQRLFSQHAQTIRARFQQQQKKQNGRRWQSTAEGQQQQQQQQSWFKRAWESEVGIKTVHFWAPVMKVRLYIGQKQFLQLSELYVLKKKKKC